MLLSDDRSKELSNSKANYDDLENRLNGQLEEPNYYKQRRSALEVLKRNLDQLGGPNLVRRSVQEFKDHDGLEKYTYGIISNV